MTQWFPGNIKPFRPGVYEIRKYTPQVDRHWAYYDGSRWGFYECRIDMVQIKENTGWAMQDKIWRGLVSESNA